MNILFLSRWFPFPANNGSKIRIYHLLKGLSHVHDVTLLSFYDPNETSPEQVSQFPFCSHVQLVPWKPFDARSRKAKWGFFSLSPRSLLDTYSPAMASLIINAVANGNFDLIIASQLTMASYYPLFGTLPAIFEEIELGLFVDQAFKSDHWIRRLRPKLTWFKLSRYFSRILFSFTACTVVSERERQIITDNFPEHRQKIEVFPNCINLDDYQGIDIPLKRHQLIFTGSFLYHPNYYAMQWFLRHVYPLILEKIPDVQLVITGDHANLPLPPAKNIILAGYVEDIKSLIASCSVSIAPLWDGGGTRLKILESMAIGTPVVATSKGAEGLLVQDGKHILISDEPVQFAEYVIKLLRDNALRERLSSNSLQLIKDEYDWPIIMPRLLQFIERKVG